VETVLHDSYAEIIGRADVEARVIGFMRVTRDLRLVHLYGRGLRRMNVDASVATGTDYALSRAWSLAFWQHRDRVDGIAYHARHDDSQLCVALFDRAADAVEQDATFPLLDDGELLLKLCERYGVELDLT
jgi:hypothetical protein